MYINIYTHLNKPVSIKDERLNNGTTHNEIHKMSSKHLFVVFNKIRYNNTATVYK